MVNLPLSSKKQWPNKATIHTEENLVLTAREY